MRFLSFFRSVVVEMLIIFALIFTLNNNLKNDEVTIKADGKGYYDYLPSLFIYHDLVRKDVSRIQNADVYKRVNQLTVYVRYKQYLINKYPVGTAILILPFFAYTYAVEAIHHNQIDGFGRPFQISVFHAALLYLFLGLLFLKKTLKLYNFKPSTIILCLVLLTFATSVIIYTSFDAAFSHIYSLFAVIGFIYFIKSYFLKKKWNDFLWASLFLGLIILIRPVNALIVFFIPFIAGSFDELRIGFSSLFRQPAKLVAGSLVFLGVISIQCLMWYFQTGTFLLYSYQNEGFNWGSPEIVNVLFSFRKGLFIYTPVLLVTLLGLISLVYYRQYYLLLTWLMFFALITYVISSWWCWYYGGSYGMRAYIEYYVIFFILFALMFDKMSVWLRVPIALIALSAIPLNILQAKQYKEFILNWSEMDKDKYWKVFLKQDDIFKGLLWKKTYDYNRYDAVFAQQIGKKIIEPGMEDTLFSIYSNQIKGFNEVSIIQVNVDNSFSEEDKTRLVLSVQDTLTNKLLYSHNPPLIFYADGKLNTMQPGHYDYEFKPIKGDSTKRITLKSINSSRQNILDNVNIMFLKR